MFDDRDIEIIKKITNKKRLGDLANAFARFVHNNHESSKQVEIENIKNCLLDNNIRINELLDSTALKMLANTDLSYLATNYIVIGLLAIDNLHLLLDYKIEIEKINMQEVINDLAKGKFGNEKGN